MRLTALVALLAALAAAGARAEAADWDATVCSAGRSGEHPAGLDQDGDAIPDSEDWCEDTPPGARVGPDGCADGEVPAHCEPAEPEVPPLPAAPQAPPVDSDGDGVADDADRCANTPHGLAVDAHGCVVIEKVVLRGVNFATGSARLLPDASATLRTVAQAMKASPQVRVEIGGYTDSVGDAAKNRRLSERRAQSVKTFLVGEGVEAARLTTQGYGEADPVDSNETPAGRANNRRVTFKVSRE